MTKLNFDIIINESLGKVTSVPQLVNVVNNHILSLINDFEDANWRYSKFQSYLWDNIAQTALSARERSALVNKSHTELIAAAQKLRLTDKDEAGKGSEIAEVFLYGIMKHYFNALPVVPKIFYKQNSQDNAKGSDSVHIVISDDDFTLWFGEAKFYNSIENSRLDSVVTSVINSLATDKLKKENSIITSLSELDHLSVSSSLIEKIKNALSNQESIDNLKSKIHIPILLLHECKITASTTDLSVNYKDNIIKYHKDRAESYFIKQIAKSGSIHKYDDLHFHIILFPVPNKKKIVEAFLESVAFYQGQA